MVVVWSQPAREDLRLIYQYIARDSKHYAKRVVLDIADKTTVLTDLPHLGKVVPEIGEENVREIGMYSYRILYEVMAETIIIHGVIHKRRHFNPDELQQQG